MAIPSPFNVLITSLSKKVPLIREVRKALGKITPDGVVIGADCDPDCIGRYFVDHFWIMPRIEKIDGTTLIRYCKEHRIRAIIPTRDGELPFFSTLSPRLAENGVAVLAAAPESVDTCLDKKKFSQRIAAIKWARPIPVYKFPDASPIKRWVVKERFGAGSRKICMDVSREQARELAISFKQPIFQPYIQGLEFSVDLYISATGAIKGCVPRTRDVVCHGESMVTSTVHHPEIARCCREIMGILGLTGHALVQLIVDKKGDLHVVECNCRFGGASSISIAAGLDSFYWFFLECLGSDLSKSPFLENAPKLRQIRYAEDKIIEMR